MKVAINWIKEIVELNKPFDEVVELINLKTIGTKEVTDKFIELDMKGYNRADLLSLRGVASELSAVLNSKVLYQEEDVASFDWIEKSYPKIDVLIKSDLCPLYSLVKVEKLKVGPSPKEWVEKLESSGMRSINNVADITNLVMLEFGQPLHAFDASRVKDETIIVRLASEGETLQTLDNKMRKLNGGDLLITDPEKILGLAGVMGGKESEISESSKTILLEAAIFDPSTLRQTSTRLGLNSEASKRFYHGLSRRRLLQALNAAIKMLRQIGGEVSALTMHGDLTDRLEKIPLRLKKLNSLVGVEFKNTEVENYLKRLNFEAKRVDDFSWVIIPPYYRLDVSIEEDVIEEVARMYGYERIPSSALPGKPPAKIDQSLFELISNVKTQLVDLGLSEVQTYSYYSTNLMNALGLDESKNESFIKVANPISKETEYLRQSIWANLVEAAAKNEKQGIRDLAIFEVGKVFFPKEGEWPEEKWSVAGLLINGTDNPLAELNKIFGEIRDFKDIKLEQANLPENIKGVLHPNRYLEIRLNGEQIGGASEIHTRVLDKLGITKRTAIFEIFLDKLLK